MRYRLRLPIIILFFLILNLFSTISALDMDGGQLKLYIDDTTGKFSLSYFDSRGNQTVPLLEPINSEGSYFSIIINSQVYRLGESRHFVPVVNDLDNEALVFWGNELVNIDQQFSFITLPSSGGKVAGVAIKLILHNITNNNLSVGIKALFNTVLSDREGGTILYVPSAYGADALPVAGFDDVTAQQNLRRNYSPVGINNENTLSGQAGYFWLSKRRGSDAGLLTLLIDPATIPDNIIFANQRRLDRSSWLFPTNSENSFTLYPDSINDSAVAHYYSPVLLGANQKRELTLLLYSYRDYYDYLASIESLIEGPEVIHSTIVEDYPPVETSEVPETTQTQEALQVEQQQEQQTPPTEQVADGAAADTEAPPEEQLNFSFASSGQESGPYTGVDFASRGGSSNNWQTDAVPQLPAKDYVDGIKQNILSAPRQQTLPGSSDYVDSPVVSDRTQPTTTSIGATNPDRPADAVSHPLRQPAVVDQQPTGSYNRQSAPPDNRHVDYSLQNPSVAADNPDYASPPIAYSRTETPPDNRHVDYSLQNPSVAADNPDYASPSTAYSRTEMPPDNRHVDYSLQNPSVAADNNPDSVYGRQNPGQRNQTAVGIDQSSPTPLPANGSVTSVYSHHTPAETPDGRVQTNDNNAAMENVDTTVPVENEPDFGNRRVLLYDSAGNVSTAQSDYTISAIKEMNPQQLYRYASQIPELTANNITEFRPQLLSILNRLENFLDNPRQLGYAQRLAINSTIEIIRRKQGQLNRIYR